jgi:hypothetical protein
MANSKKIDIKKQGLESIKDPVVKANLMGISRKMQDKNWVDSQGRKGKVICISSGHPIIIVICCSPSRWLSVSQTELSTARCRTPRIAAASACGVLLLEITHL